VFDTRSKTFSARSTSIRRRSAFHLDHQNLPAFGQVSIGELSSFSAALGLRLQGDAGWPKARAGGWNRVILRVNDLAGAQTSISRIGACAFATTWKSPRRQADPNRRSRRQADRAVRASRRLSVFASSF
jgi:hypothetical protein